MSTSKAYDLTRTRPIVIRLTKDLTRYHPDLQPGVEGTTCFDPATWGCWCYFPGAGKWDIIMTSTEIIDEEYLRLKAEDEAARMDELKRAQDVTLHLGPRGGFRHVSYRIPAREGEPGRFVSQGFRDNGMKLVEFFRTQGIPVTEIREP